MSKKNTSSGRAHFQLLRAKKFPDTLCLEITPELLKLALLRGGGLRREVSELHLLEVQGMDDAQIAGQLGQIIARIKPVRPKTYLVSPLPSLITRTIEVPSVDPKEIQEIVNLQASRHTPYARSEIIVDMINRGIVRKAYTKLMLVILPKEIVNRQLQMIERIGLKVEKVIFAPEALSAAFQKISGKSKTEDATAFIHMDSVHTVFMVVSPTALLFVRSIAIGRDQLEDGSSSILERFSDEMESSIEAYQTDEAGPSPKQAVLIGGAKDNKVLEQAVADVLKIPARTLIYYQHVAVSKNALETAAASAVSFFDVITSALLADKCKVDLITDERKLRRQLEVRARQIAKAAIWILLSMSLVCVDYALKLHTRKQYLQNLSQRYKPVMEQAKALESAYEKSLEIQNYLESRGMSLDALAAFHEITPLDTKLTYVKMDETGKIVIRGTSSMMSSVFAYVQALEKSSLFQGVKTKYVNSRQENGVDLADFEINCALDYARKPL